MKTLDSAKSCKRKQLSSRRFYSRYNLTEKYLLLSLLYRHECLVIEPQVVYFGVKAGKRGECNDKEISQKASEMVEY